MLLSEFELEHRIFRNNRPGRLIFTSITKHSKTHQNPLVLCTPPFGKSSIKAHRFCVLPPLKITVFDGRLFRVAVYFGKYGDLGNTTHLKHFHGVDSIQEQFSCFLEALERHDVNDLSVARQKARTLYKSCLDTGEDTLLSVFKTF